MNYPFFVAPIVRLNNEMVQRLAINALDLTFDPFPSLKTLAHSDYHEHTTGFKQACMDVHKAIAFFDDSQIVRFTVTKLLTGHIADEHSDYYVQKGAASNLERIDYQHKIHVPLITNKQALSLHRRTRTQNFTSYHMPTGWAYAYNDVAWHKIINTGAEDRYHLIIFYADKTRSVKRRICDHLKIDYTNFYEDITYAYPFEHKEVVEQGP